MPEYVVPVGDIANDPSLTFEEGRDRLVARLKQSEWLRATPDYELVHGYVAELERAQTPLELHSAWAAVLDEATYARVLLSTNIITKGD